jgi:hypothetical protein
MPLQSIVVIVLRLFCIQWFVQGITLSISVAQTIGYGGHGLSAYSGYFIPAGLFLLSICCWLGAPFISRMVTRRNDSPLNVAGLTRRDLYCFAFVFVGLNFALSSLGMTMNTLYYFIKVIRETYEGASERTSASYNLARYGVTLAGGVVAILFAEQWAVKLDRIDSTNAKSSPVEESEKGPSKDN